MEVWLDEKYQYGDGSKVRVIEVTQGGLCIRGDVQGIQTVGREV